MSQSESVAARNQLLDVVFTPEEQDQLHNAVIRKYQKVAESAEGLFRYRTGKQGAVALGYGSTFLDSIPDEAVQSFCGVGNPFSIQPIREGSQVLDIGCGGGLDLLIAAQLAGPGGKVVGIDLSEEMVIRAQSLIEESGVGPLTVQRVPDESLPFAEDSFDHVISNGVINLSPSKLKLFKEIRRVLKPGGYLQFADIILARELPPDVGNTLDDWAQ